MTEPILINGYLTRWEWHCLPFSLRVAWWMETHFDRLAPSAALLCQVRDAVKAWEEAHGRQADHDHAAGK
jgi:hypothetical protein